MATNLAPAGAMAVDTSNGTTEEFQVDLNQTVMCPECKEWPPNLVEEFSSGDLVCGTCGMVLDSHVVDTRSEWRTFANDDQNGDDPSRVGDAINPLLNGSQLETGIQFDQSKQGRDLARVQNRMQQDKGTKGLLQAYKQIGALCDAMNMGKNVADAAKHIYKLADDEKFLKGKPQDAVVAGCIFIACRQADVPRTFREIHNLTNVSKKEVGRVFKALETFLKRQETNNKKQTAFSVTSWENKATTGPEALVARYVSQIGFRRAQRIENISIDLARRAANVGDLAGRSPLSIAAACIYMASHLTEEPKTSKEIANVSGVSDGTIKTAYKFLYQLRHDLVRKEWADAAALDKLPVS
jgi:transcription initiation factor TFIIB